jgi:hypothetical protein
VTSCIVDSAAIYIMVVKFRNTIWSPPPQLSLHRRAALSSNSNGTRSVYSRENTKSSLYCEMSMCLISPLNQISLYLFLTKLTPSNAKICQPPDSFTIGKIIVSKMIMRVVRLKFRSRDFVKFCKFDFVKMGRFN